MRRHLRPSLRPCGTRGQPMPAGWWPVAAAVGARVTVTAAEPYLTHRGLCAHTATVVLRDATDAHHAVAAGVDLGAWCVRDPRRRGVWHVAAPVPDGALCAEPLGDADRRAVEGHAEEAAARVGEALGMPRGKPPWVA